MVQMVQKFDGAGERTLLTSGRVDGKGSQSYAPQLSPLSDTVLKPMPAICLAILVVELCERLAFNTLVGTQEFFLEHLGYSLADAGSLNSTMGTLCTAWALFVCWIADVVLGRYQTILIFGMIYSLGASIAAAAAWPGSESPRWYMSGVMVLVPIGTAGIKANISNFGADQYDTTDPRQVVAQEKFFFWFYVTINLGSLVADGFLTTLGTNGGLGVPKHSGYFAVYIVAAVSMLVAVIIFRAGRSYYRIRPLQRVSPLTDVAREVGGAASGGSLKAACVCIGSLAIFCGIFLSVVATAQPEGTRSRTVGMLSSFICVAAGTTGVVLPCLKPASWLGNRHDVETTPASELGDCIRDDVRDYLRLLPVLFSGNLAYGALYNSMRFWYQQQACQMDIRMPFSTDSGKQFAGSFYTTANCVACVLVTPLALGWLNPLLERRMVGRFGHNAKYCLGIAFAAASVLVAALLEVLRRAAPVMKVTSNCAPEGIQMSQMSASWMTLPCVLMGVGEIYTQPVLMHLSYTQSPVRMRTLSAATSLIIAAVSQVLFTVLIAALAPFLPNDLNQGHLEYGHYVNILIALFFFFAYTVAIRSFEEKHFDR